MHEKRFEEEEEQNEEEENASSNSSPSHHEIYGAAAPKSGVENFKSNHLSSNICHSISIDVGKFSRVHLKTFKSDKTMSLRRNEEIR